MSLNKMAPEEIIDRVNTALMEGRLENVLERQKQLASLHKSLQKNFNGIVTALEEGKPPLLFTVSAYSRTSRLRNDIRKRDSRIGSNTELDKSAL